GEMEDCLGLRHDATGREAAPGEGIPADFADLEAPARFRDAPRLEEFNAGTHGNASGVFRELAPYWRADLEEQPRVSAPEERPHRPFRWTELDGHFRQAAREGFGVGEHLIGIDRQHPVRARPRRLEGVLTLMSVILHGRVAGTCVVARAELHLPIHV